MNLEPWDEAAKKAKAKALADGLDTLDQQVHTPSVPGVKPAHSTVSVALLAGIALCLLCLYGFRSTAPTKPGAVGFDPRDPEVTFRWLIQEALPINESSKASDDEHFNNPLRKDAYNAHKVNEQRWDQFLKRLSGKRITWPATIERITEKEVDFACLPEGVSEKDITAKVRFDPYPEEYEDDLRVYRSNSGHCNGMLIIGRDIGQDTARTLNRKMWLAIEGTVEKAGSNVAEPHTRYPEVQLYVKITGVLVPVAK